MKKIPTLFLRDPENRSRVISEVNPDCEWVMAGEGVATAKWDGTCVLIDAGGAYARREVKPGKQAPDCFMEIDYDPVTGKRMGWEPIEQTGWIKFFEEAIQRVGLPAGPNTYELCGPKVNGNPHGFTHHVLVPHGEVRDPVAPRTFDALRIHMERHPHYEGIVWYHPDGRRAKIKRRDFGLPWPAEATQ